MNSLEFKSTINSVIEFPRPAHFTYDVEIYVESDIKFKPYSVVNLSFKEDYINAYGSTVMLELAMSMGDYMRWIYPYREKNIQMRVIKKFVGSHTDVEIDLKGLETTYRAFCSDSKDEDLQNKPNIDLDQTIANYKFELIEINTYDIRLRTCGGTYPKQDKIDLIKFMYARAALAIPEPYRSIGITADPANVKEPKRQLVVDDGTLLVDLPKYLQVKESGIYNHDIANFFSPHKKRWFIFPAFNTARHSASNYLLEIFLNPSNATAMLDRTWKYEVGLKKKVTIISTDNFKSMDSKVFNFLNQGNAIKFLLGDKIFNEYLKVDSNKLEIGNDHVAGFVLEERKDDKQSIRFQPTRVTNNVAAAMSELSRKSGMYVSVTWTHSRYDLLIPGMPVTINYITENTVKTKIGILHEAIHVDTRLQAQVTNKTFYSTSILIIFVDDPDTEIKTL